MESKKKNLFGIYFRWPFYIGLMLAVLTVPAFFEDVRSGCHMLILVGVYFILTGIAYLVFRKRISKMLAEFGASYAQAQNQLLRQVDIPFAMCDTEGSLLWTNPAFNRCFPEEKGRELWRLFPEADNADFSRKDEYHVSFGDRRYVLRVSPLEMQGLELLVGVHDSGGAQFYNVYLIDETELLYCRRTLEEEKCVLCLIYLDNYEEVMAGVESVRRSLLAALVERKLNKYIAGVRGVIRKMEKDRFFVVLKQEALWELQDRKFSLLQEIKTVNIGNEMAMTISMGIGLGGESFEQNYEFARAAIDMALARGGDQVVIKENGDIRYYGGKAQSTEHSTRVKARIKAHALRELIEAKEDVIIMGHPISDLDCIGAAVGISRAARFSGKKPYIVAGTLNASVQPLIDSLKNNPEYDNELFISPGRALELIHQDTLLVVVDTNRPSYTECPELLQKTRSVVVMDHHRQGREKIEDAVLSYVEPFASSASEMVAEVVQYYDDALRLRPLEADAVFAGIVMDTNNFADKSGVRTFEAAAYLRRCGADVTRVRKLFRENEEDYKLRAETVQKAEIFREGYIIGICPKSSSPSQTVVAAQAANELLEIRGIRASFVATEFEGKVYLSARSIDEVNVQVMMEKLGGGGHQSVAGAQFTDLTVPEVLDRLKEIITEQTKEE